MRCSRLRWRPSQHLITRAPGPPGIEKIWGPSNRGVGTSHNKLRRSGAWPACCCPYLTPDFSTGLGVPGDFSMALAVPREFATGSLQHARSLRCPGDARSLGAHGAVLAVVLAHVVVHIVAERGFDPWPYGYHYFLEAAP